MVLNSAVQLYWSLRERRFDLTRIDDAVIVDMVQYGRWL